MDTNNKPEFLFGYICAWFMVYLKETIGYPLEECSIKCAELGQRIEYSGLRYELLKIGMKESLVDLNVKRCKDAWELARKTKDIKPLEEIPDWREFRIFHAFI